MQLVHQNDKLSFLGIILNPPCRSALSSSTVPTMVAGCHEIRIKHISMHVNLMVHVPPPLSLHYDVFGLHNVCVCGGGGGVKYAAIAVSMGKGGGGGHFSKLLRFSSILMMIMSQSTQAESSPWSKSCMSIILK